MKQRLEHDLLGSCTLPADVLWGIHTQRAVDNFPVTGHHPDKQLIHSYGLVKLACIRTARASDLWKLPPDRIDALETACRELAEGLLDNSVHIDALSGGAGTSLNMNVNEVITNRALQLLGHAPGDYDCISPLDDTNIFQSTNDTFPTALRHAAIVLLRSLEQHLVNLQEAFIEKEKEFADVVKVGRTEMQDAVLITLGREMGAYAEAFGRDRWRIYKCEERLRTVNLGGTAIGTGIAAPRSYIFSVVDTLSEVTGIGFARAENLFEATQNSDVFAEVSGILSACAVSLQKCANDLRFLSSGPDAGIGEITLPARQAGSSIMPGKINPVIPEAVVQAVLAAQGLHGTLCSAAAAGHMELNPFLPLIADTLLQELRLITAAVTMLDTACVRGITANREHCRRQVESSTAAATALLPALGYVKLTDIVARATASGKTVKQLVIDEGLLDEAQFSALTSPEAVCRLGTPFTADTGAA